MLCDTVVTVRCFEVCKTSKLPARTCKKLPVASFCASETAETGRIANGCEQGDHVSRRKGAIARAACYPDRGMLYVKRKVPERERVYSFCFCKKNQKAAARTCKKLPVASFCASETAETGRIANGCEQGDHVSRSRLRPATSVQIAGRCGVFGKMTSAHQVTGYVETVILHGIDGNDLNRC